MVTLTAEQNESLTRLLGSLRAIPNIAELVAEAGGIGEVVTLKPLTLTEDEAKQQFLVIGKTQHRWAFGPSGPCQWIVEISGDTVRSLLPGTGRAAIGKSSLVAILDSSTCGYRNLVLGDLHYCFSDDCAAYKFSGKRAGSWTRLMIALLGGWKRFWHHRRRRKAERLLCG
jgi:hypothetical protein